MASQQQPRQKALTARSLFVAVSMVLLWTLGCCFMVATDAVRSQHLLMIVGFGAVLTIFLLQFPYVFVAVVVVTFLGTGGYMLAGAPRDEYSVLIGGLLRSLPVVVILCALAVWLRRRPLHRGELAVVYAAVAVAIPWCICMRAVIQSSAANLFEIQRESEEHLYTWARDLPWWAPSVHAEPLPKVPKGKQLSPRELAAREAEAKRRADEAERITRRNITGFARGNGGRVAWRYWWKPIVYWTAMCFAWQGMLMGLLLLFRKRFIEHERLPFVWSQPALEIIRTGRKGRPRVQWILFGIGLAICLPSVLFLSPRGEPLANWPCLPWAGLQSLEGPRAGVDLTALNLLPGTTLRLWWGPMVLALFLLFPVDVLMTVALTHILLVILLPGMMRWMGISVGPQLLGSFVKNGLRFGGALGLLFWSVWFNRRTIWGYVRSLWGGKPTDAPSEDELGRKKVFLIFAVGLVGFFLLGLHATNAIEMALLTCLILIFSFGQIRQRIAGLPMTYDNNFGSHQMVSIQRDFLGTHFGVASQDPNVPVTGDGFGTHWMQWGFNGQLKSLGPHNLLLEAFKVGHELRVHARDIAKVVLIAMIVVAAITPALFIYLMHMYGYENNFVGQLTTGQDFGQWSERAASYSIHSTSQVFKIRGAEGFYETYKAIFHMIYGVIIVGVLFYLRREYPRFPISPIGVVIAAEFYYHTRGMPFSADIVWFSYLIVWIAKWLIFRWLGVRSFREKIVPGAIMLLCGMIFGMMAFIFRQIGLLQGCVK